MAITLRVDSVGAGNKTGTHVLYITAVDDGVNVAQATVTYSTDLQVMRQAVIAALRPKVMAHLALKNKRLAVQTLLNSINLETE